MTVPVKILSWNVDGLGERFPTERAKAASEIILRHRPDIVHLQEVTASTQKVLTTALKTEYQVAQPRTDKAEYFSLTYIKRNHSILEATTEAFTGAAKSIMGRGLEMTTIEIDNTGVIILAVNTHLESMKEYTKPRVAQLQAALAKISSFSGPAILAGDLNARDPEVEAARKVMGKSPIFDAWEAAGKPSNHRWTWSMPGNPSIQARFDRAFGNGCMQMGVSQFDLCGQEALPGPVFNPPSDHKGIITVFTVDPSSPPVKEDKPQPKRVQAPASSIRNFFPTRSPQKPDNSRTQKHDRTQELPRISTDPVETNKRQKS